MDTNEAATKSQMAGMEVLLAETVELHKKYTACMQKNQVAEAKQILDQLLEKHAELTSLANKYLVPPLVETGMYKLDQKEFQTALDLFQRAIIHGAEKDLLEPYIAACQLALKQ